MRRIIIVTVVSVCSLAGALVAAARNPVSDIIPAKFRFDSPLEALQGAVLGPTSRMICGPVCLYLGCKHFGLDSQLYEIAELARWNHLGGTSLLGLQEACHAMGMSAEALELSVRQLKKLRADHHALAIVENKEHYLLLRQKGGGFMAVSTPHLKPVALSEQNLTRFWNGKALLFARQPLELPQRPSGIRLWAGATGVAAIAAIGGIWLGRLQFRRSTHR
jgi:hypothetical protein